MFDIAITEDGDLLFDTTNKDLYEINGDDLRLQMAMCRIKSIRRDWFKDNIGANMEEILGLPCTVDTQNLGSKMIISSLTFDGLFKSNEIYIVSESVKNTGINYKVYIKDLGKESSVLIELELDLVKGINIIGE